MIDLSSSRCRTTSTAGGSWVAEVPDRAGTGGVANAINNAIGLRLTELPVPAGLAALTAVK